MLRDVAEQLAAGEARIIGVMVESHLVAGRQDLEPGRPLAYGQSITDACIGWEDTVAVLDLLAEGVAPAAGRARPVARARRLSAKRHGSRARPPHAGRLRRGSML